MNKFSSTAGKALLAAVFSLGAMTQFSVAHADDQTATGRHGHALTQEERAAKMAEHKAKFAEMVAKHQAAFHDQLKLTAAQEPAWATFTAAVTPTLPANMPDRAAIAAMSAPERMEKHLAMAKLHLAKQETRLAATKVFYAQLTATQQKTFDEETAKMHRRFGHGHPGHRTMMMHHGQS